MASDEPTQTPAPGEDAGDDAPQGVFGNLPHTRPGARSPRRDRAAGARGEPAAARATPGTGQQASAAERGADADQTPQGPQAGPQGESAPGAEGGGIEDVAWAGVAAAAEAATIGVRLATRALEAMRDTVDRR